MSALRRLKATIAVALLAMTFSTQGCLPENFYADLASSSIKKVVDSALSAVLDCLLPSEPTAE